MENQFKECLFSLFNLLWPLNREEWRRRLFIKVERWLDVFLVFYLSGDISGRALLLQATAELVELIEGLPAGEQVNRMAALDAEKRLLVFQTQLLRSRAFKKIHREVPILTVQTESNFARQQLRGRREVNQTLKEEIISVVGQFEKGCKGKEIISLLGGHFSPRTIYRYLELLDQQGVIRRFGSGSNIKYSLIH